uniref:Pentacotripeptide-repeat region of PRORP domain-containing protein n=1 Tax=Picea sitchensis TaxID=3332 RepID=C0PSL5_PICSI|nr:unknown [Picea sitchensis]
MGSAGLLTIVSNSTEIHKLASNFDSIPTTHNCKRYLLDFQSGQRFVEIPSAAGGRNRRLRWSIQIPSVCNMRDKGQNRGPLWRGRILSTEAIQAVQALRRAKGDPQRLEKAFATKIPRLLKKDLLAVLQELQRQDQCDLALQVFKAVRKEMWYRPNLSLHADMIMMLGRNKRIEEVEAVLLELQKEGLRPDTRVCTEIIGAFIHVGMVQNAMETFELMKQTDCHPDKSTFTVLIQGLQRLGEIDLATAVREQSVQYLDEPLEIFEDVSQEVLAL